MAYQERLARLRELLAEAQMDALAVVAGANLRYLTNMQLLRSERLTLAIIPRFGDEIHVVLPAMEAAHAKDEAATPITCYPWTDAEGPLEALRQALTMGLSRVHGAPPVLGIEAPSMSVRELRLIENYLAEMTSPDASALLSSMRMAKDADELAAMRDAITMIETALDATIKQIRPGMTERQLSAIWSQQIAATGSEGESFGNIVGGGPNSANPHHNNSDRPFQAGDLIVLDGGAVCRGYASDITRTVALGEPGPEARRIYELVKAANAAGRAAVHPGTTGEAVDRAARSVIEQGGYGAAFLHRTGHGLGLEIHEPPDMASGKTEPLRPGMTFTIEPGIYVNGVGGVRIEDNVVVTPEGSLTMTSYNRDLIVIPTE